MPIGLNFVTGYVWANLKEIKKKKRKFNVNKHSIPATEQNTSELKIVRNIYKRYRDIVKKGINNFF